MATPRMKIAMVTQWYDPEMGAAIMPGTIARALRDRGNEVHVVTGFPNYPQGELYPGYRLRPYMRESLEGITVHRAPLYLSHDANPVRRAANYASFAASASAVAVARLRGLDAALVHSSPATAALPAMALRLLAGTPYVVHVQDLWPDTVVQSDLVNTPRGGRVERVLHVFCDRVYRHAAAIAVTSPGMAELIASRGVPAEKISFIPNWADENRFRPVENVDPGIRHEMGPLRPFTVMYAGAMGEIQGLDVLLGAAELLQGNDEIGILFVGGGVAEQALRGRAADAGLDNVRFIGHQPAERMADILALGDVQVISLRDSPLFHSTIPSKVQATLAAGRPVICAVSGDGAAAIREAGAGPTVTSGSASEMAEAILRMSRMPRDELAALGGSGRRHYERAFSQARGAEALEGLLASAAAGRKAR